MKACFAAMLAGGLVLATMDADARCGLFYGNMPDVRLTLVPHPLGNLPDLVVGDLDRPNCVGEGENSFTFVNAFRFDLM